MQRLFWCEFPDKCDWKKLAKYLGKRKISVYVTCASREEFERRRKNLEKDCPTVEVNVWPICPIEEGYWFSGFSSKKTLDRLDEYHGLKLKIDVEPPKPKKFNFFSISYWLGKTLLFRTKNYGYLQKKIMSLENGGQVVISTFPLPSFLLKNWGWKKGINSYMYYTSFIPSFFLPLYNLYYKRFISHHKNSFFAVGLMGVGIFGNEPEYKHIGELKRDLVFLKSQGVEKFVFFRIGGIVEKGKDWLDVCLE
jgi:hypothetical protein